MNIYELTNVYVSLQRKLEEGDIDEKTFKDTLDSIDITLEEKAENYAKIIRNIDKDIEGLKAEENRLKAKRQSLENNIKRLKDNLETSMKETGKTKFKTNLFSFGIQKNPPSVKLTISDDAFISWAEKNNDLLLNYTTPTINKKAILENLKEGKVVFGAELSHTESLRIR